MKRVLWHGFALLGLWTLVSGLYGSLAPRPSDSLPEEIVLGEGDVDLPATLALHFGVPVLEGNRIVLLENGDEIFPPMLAAIRNARERVDLLTYVYWTGEIAREFAGALADAARRGVRVRVLLDGVGAQRIDEALLEEMQAAGCKVAWFHPVSRFDLDRINHRTHRKLLVVDEEVAFTGGVGIAEEWTGDAQGPDHWRDDHFELRGPIVSSLEGGFVENWLDATGEVLARTARTAPDTSGPGAPGGIRMVAVDASPPYDKASPVSFTYWLALQTARSRVEIATPYFVPDPSIRDALVDAARRGVAVRLLVPGDRNDSRLVRWASQAFYRELLDAGVEIWEFQPTMMHVKAITVDDRWAIVGSANFDNRSFEMNDENLVIADDRELARELRASFEADLERSVRIAAEDFEGLRWWKRAGAAVGLLIREQL